MHHTIYLHKRYILCFFAFCKLLQSVNKNKNLYSMKVGEDLGSEPTLFVGDDPKYLVCLDNLRESGRKGSLTGEVIWCS